SQSFQYLPFSSLYPTDVIVSFLILSLLGPFGVVPRCILVAYGGIKVLYPHVSLAGFSAFFSLIMLGIIWQENKIVPIIGKFLGPLKIGAILMIIFFAFINIDPLETTPPQINPFFQGIKEGYQTMDLLAAFFFSITIVEYLRKIMVNTKDMLKISLYSALLGGALIAAIYTCFVILGAYYADSLKFLKPEEYLASITLISLGKHATFVIAFTMFLACLTTAATLSRLFSEFLSQDIFRHKVSYKYATLLTLSISFLFSLMGFSSITSLLGIILQNMYPALIMLMMTSFLYKYRQINIVKESFWITLVISIIWSSL
ncbi:MAG: branched-chain amino acid transport system II carrier protein, partial [Proteobacteria bacterium]|nr:branched-chain amino acid transport system II carrier protein [Pseudomonadota bacterium]